jgi:hypothetical protein
MRDVILPQKQVDEILTITFPFQDVLQFGEVVSGAAVVCAAFIGTDVDAQDLVFGAATVTSNGFNVQQVITGGVPGVVYNLLCTANGSDGHVYTKNGKLSVIRPVEAFVGN